ncbi:MAG: hypothetical protein ACYS21_17670, partial [Planctomycetota bacterium]
TRLIFGIYSLFIPFLPPAVLNQNRRRVHEVAHNHYSQKHKRQQSKRDSVFLPDNELRNYTNGDKQAPKAKVRRDKSSSADQFVSLI